MDDLFLLLALVAFFALIVLVVLAIIKRGRGYFKKAGISLLVFIVSFVGFIATYDESEVQTEADDSNTEDSTEEVKVNESAIYNEEPSVASYSIGDVVNVGNVAYVINSIETATNVGGEWGENSQGTFLIVDLSVTNNGNEPLSIDNSFFKLLDDGKEFEADSYAGIIANDDSSFFHTSINPDLTLTGKVVFDVSDAVIKSSTKKLQVSTGYWGTETELINLQ